MAFFDELGKKAQTVAEVAAEKAKAAAAVAGEKAQNAAELAKIPHPAEFERYYNL